MQSRLLRGPAVRIVSGYHCVSFAPGGFSSRRVPSPAFLAVLAPPPLNAPTTQRWFLISTTREVCARAPYTSWRTRSLCGPKTLAESSLYSWASQYRSRHPVEAGAEARGIEASPRGGEADLESFWPGTGGSVCDSSDIALSPLLLSDSSSSTGAGCYGTDVAEASSVRHSPDRSAPRSSRESAP